MFGRQFGRRGDRIRLSIVLALLGCLAVRPAAAQPSLIDPVLDAVPAEVSAAFVIRDFERFVEAYEPFAERSGGNDFGDLRELRSSGLRFLGLDAGTDPNGSAMLVVLEPANGNPIGLDHLAVAIPIADVDAALNSIGLTRERFGEKRRNVVTRGPEPRGEFGGLLPCVALTEKHLWFALTAAPLETIARSERSWLDALGPERSRFLNDHQVMLLFDGSKPTIRLALREELQRRLDQADRSPRAEGDGPKHQDDAARLLDAFGELERVGIGLTFGNSLTMAAQANFGGDASRSLLEDLSGSAPSDPTSDSPPDDGAAPIVSLQIGRGLLQHPRVAQVAIETILQYGLPYVGSSSLLRDVPDLFDLLQELGERLDGVAIRWVANDDPATDGAYAASVRLASSDPAALRKRLREWERWLELSQTDEATFRREVDRPSLERLIADLGADEFATREEASRRLARVARFVERELNAAADGGDLEVAFRARMLIETARAAASRTAEEELTLLARLKPRLGEVEPTADEAARGITRLRLQLAGEEAFWSDEAARLFGPAWDRPTMATRPDSLLLLVGSNERWIRERLETPPSGESSLDAADRSDERTTLPRERIAALFSADIARWFGQPTPESSLGPVGSLEIAFGIEPDRLEVEVSLTPEGLGILREVVTGRSANR